MPQAWNRIASLIWPEAVPSIRAGPRPPHRVATILQEIAFMKPNLRPRNTHFSSGPCAKRPGWSLEALSDALVGRSHRSKPGKAKLAEVIDLSRSILGIPEPTVSDEDAISTQGM